MPSALQTRTSVWDNSAVEEIFVNGNIVIYPNPADNQLNIKFEAIDNINLDVSLSDMSGRVVLQDIYSANRGSDLIKLGIGSISNGVYFLNIGNDSNSLNYKIVVK